MKTDGAFDKAWKHKCATCEREVLFFQVHCHECLPAAKAALSMIELGMNFSTAKLSTDCFHDLREEYLLTGRMRSPDVITEMHRRLTKLILEIRE